MKISDFMEDLYNFTDPEKSAYKGSCDTLKIGNPDQEVRKIATTMFPTEKVLRDAAAWGANLLIVHEPAIYDHFDDSSKIDSMPDWKKELVNAKIHLIKELGLTIYRYHDHPHRKYNDMIGDGELRALGLKGTWKRGDYFGINKLILDEPMQILELARLVEKKLKIQHVRICGSRKTLCKEIGLCFGATGHIEEELTKNDVLLTGEVCEWQNSEFVRDYAEFLHKDKTMLVLGHLNSEREGMNLLADVIRERYPQFEVKYLEGEDVYSYTDSKAE